MSPSNKEPRCFVLCSSQINVLNHITDYSNYAFEVWKKIFCLLCNQFLSLTAEPQNTDLFQYYLDVANLLVTVSQCSYVYVHNILFPYESNPVLLHLPMQWCQNGHHAFCMREEWKWRSTLSNLQFLGLSLHGVEGSTSAYMIKIAGTSLHGLGIQDWILELS